MDENRVTQKLIEHDERLYVVEQRMDSLLTRDAFLSVMDKMTAGFNRLNQEYLSIVGWLERLDVRLEKVEGRLERVEQHLQIS